MGMPQASPAWTAAKVRVLPDDGNRYEAVRGELLVTPAPGRRHQRAAGGLFVLLANYLEASERAEVLFSPADIELDELTLVQPDLFVLPLVEGRKSSTWREITTLLLAVEVLSPSTARYDRLTKRRLYQQQGIEYWIVDLDARVVERWLPGSDRPEILAERLEWQPDLSRPPLVIELEEFFGRVWQE
jgi:Uma2 family endonuclease